MWSVRVMSARPERLRTRNASAPPGDWDAWVSQGPVTLHSREHLGTTDRGVIMCRKLVRQGIRAVAEDDTATARHYLLPLCRRTFNAFPASIGWPSQRIAL